MAINKIVYNGGTLIDLTGDTVTSASLMQGYIAHDRSGEIIIGTATGGFTIITDEEGEHGDTIRHITTGETVEGSTTLTSNGTHNVAHYVTAVVDVEPTLQSKSVTPSETAQTVSPDGGYDGLSQVNVGAISSTYVGSGITRRTSSDLTASGATVSVPSGYYESNASKAVTSGSATAPATISGTSASVSTGTNTLTLTKTVSVTPSVSAGYVSSGTAGNSSVSLTASVTTKAAATYTPTTTAQTIASGTYLTGTQTIAGDADLVAENIKDGVEIFGVTGTYSGGGDPYPFYEDGKDRLYIKIYSLSYPTFECNVYSSASGVAQIDWGDGSTPETITTLYNSHISHTYDAVGMYVITATRLTSGDFRFQNFSSTADSPTETEYLNPSMLLAAEISMGVTTYMFQYCRKLEKVALYNGLALGTSMFAHCDSLKNVFFTASGSNVNYAFRGCNIDTIDLSNISTTISNTSYTFADSKVTSVKFASDKFSIKGSCFANCHLLQEISPINSLSTSSFANCSSLKQVLFSNNASLSSISSSAFSGCESLETITIPSTVTSVAASAFSNCTSMKSYHFLSTTPPTLANTNAFYGIPADCIIYVPQGYLNAYQTANNWSTYASYMQEEP